MRMTIAPRPTSTAREPVRTSDEAAGWAALGAGFTALLAWMACCVLPMSLALVGMTLGFAAPLAAERVPITLVAAGVLALGWVLALRRRAACGAASRRAIVLLGVATVLMTLAAAWSTVFQPPLVALLNAGMR